LRVRSQCSFAAESRIRVECRLTLSDALGAAYVKSSDGWITGAGALARPHDGVSPVISR
jgi:hypothetical protein